MRQKVKKLLWVMMLLFLVGVLVACSSGEESNASNEDTDNNASDNEEASQDSGKEEVELRILWWGSQDRHDRTLEAIDLYMEKNPHVTISPEFTGWDGYWEKMATQAAGGNLPDIVQMDYKYLSEYVGKDLLANLNPHVESGALDLSDVEDVYIDGGKIDGGLYAVNLGANSHAQAYDPAMYEKAGVEPLEPGYTYDELISKSQELSEKLGDDVYGIQPSANVMGFKHYLRLHDKWLYNDDGTGLGYEDDQLLVDFLQVIKELIDSGAGTPPELFKSAGSNIEQQSIVREQSAILMELHSNQLVALEQAAGRDLELMVQPMIEGGEKGHYIKPSQFFSVSTHSEEQEEAAKFIDFITNDLEANEILNAERGVPIAGEVREHLKSNLAPAGLKMFEFVELVQDYAREIDPPDPQGATEIESLFENEVEDPIYYGEVTPEEAAQNFREKATEILAKNK
ncbi:ABC transporter substrate-binding protein [Gracilibacillus sp. YIM 98692]|uniref:ABC transporter substrate-binding protein n=1 Tax=Gracilibacillus sp. YIM 98692 TaxID=2663532 RepID=UPI0013D73761|nr:ABC transporter substrate-binding protein [Gracilibacillus sp. YIM 98692]